MDSTTQVQIDLCAELAMLVALATDTASLGTMCLCNVGRFAGMVSFELMRNAMMGI